jgi:hypothetical protein
MNNSPENIAKAIATGIVGSIGQFIDSGEEAAEFGFLSKGIAAVLLYGLIGYFVALIVARKERQEGYPQKRSGMEHRADPVNSIYYLPDHSTDHLVASEQLG